MKIINIVYDTLSNIKAIIPNTLKLTKIEYNSTEVITIRSETVSNINSIDDNQKVVIMNDEIIPIARIIK